MKKLVVTFFSIILSFSVMAESPILVIGASFANGNTPLNDNLDGPVGGISVGLGAYLSLGDALVRNPKLSGHVINEAQAGASTFSRVSCNPVCGNSAIWQSYDIQLTKALKRVSAPGLLNAQYVVISLANDCLHSDAFGIDMSLTSPCTVTQMNEHADRMVALGQRAVAEGLTPIFLKYPDYDSFDMPLVQTLFGFNWVQSKANYEQMTDIREARIEAEVAGAVQLEVWKNFTHVGDGLHPDAKTARKAANRIARFIRRNDGMSN